MGREGFCDAHNQVCRLDDLGYGEALYQSKKCGGSKSGRKTSFYQTHLSVHILPFLDEENSLFSLTWLLLFWKGHQGILSGSWFSHLESIKQVECLTPKTQQMSCWAETGKQPSWLFRASAFQFYPCVSSTQTGEAYSSTCLLLLGGKSTKTLCVTEIFGYWLISVCDHFPASLSVAMWSPLEFQLR